MTSFTICYKSSKYWGLLLYIYICANTHIYVHTHTYAREHTQSLTWENLVLDSTNYWLHIHSSGNKNPSVVGEKWRNMFNITFDAATLHLCYQSFCLVCVRYSVLVIISQKEALVPFSSVAFTNLQHSDENKPIRIWGLKNGGCA